MLQFSELSLYPLSFFANTPFKYIFSGRSWSKDKQPEEEERRIYPIPWLRPDLVTEGEPGRELQDDDGCSDISGGY